MRSRPSRWILTLLALSTLALPALAVGKRGPSLARLLKDDTVFYVAVEPGRFGTGVAALDLAALLRAPEFQEFLAPVWEATGMIDGQDPVRSLLDQLPTSQFVQGQAAFGISGLSVMTRDAAGKPLQIRLSASHPISARMLHDLAALVQDVEDGPPFGKVSIDFLASVDAGPTLEQMAKEFLADPPPMFEVGEVMIEGVPITALNIQPPDGPLTTIYADLSGNRWLIGGDQESFTAALKGGPQQSLAESTTFKNFSGRAAGDGNVLFAYLDFARSLQTFRNLVPPIVLEEAHILGLDSLQGLALGVSLLEGGVRESFLLGFDGRPHGVFALFDAFGGGFPALADSPPATVAFAGLRFDAEVLKERVLALVRDLAPRVDRKLLAEAKHANVGPLGVFSDILPALGSELSVQVARPRTGFIPEIVFTLEVRDQQKFQALLDSARKIAEQTGEVTIIDVPLADGPPGFALRIPEAPVQPTFALRGNRLYGAISPLTLKNHLRHHVDNPKRVTLAKTSEVLPRVMKGLTGGREDLLTLLLYVDLRNTVPVLYDSFGPFLGPAFAESGLPLDVALLPLSETVAEHLTGMALGISCGPEGISIDVFSPTGLLTLGVLGSIVVGAPRHDGIAPFITDLELEVEYH